MATVTKDFRIKSGLVVEGLNGTINGSDIITEDAITGGTQTNISVTYDANTKTVSFVAENGVEDSTTDDLDEGVLNLYFTDERAQDAIATAFANGTQSGLSVTYNDNANSFSIDVNDPVITITGDVDGSATMTNLGNTTIDVTLDTVNSNVGTFGGSTTIPVVTVNAKGLVTAVGTENIATTLTVSGDSGTSNIALLTDTLTFSGGEGIDVTVANNDTVTIAAEDASTSNKGVASFNTNNFTVTDGAVSAKSITLGGSTLELGGNTTALAGLTQLSVDNIQVDGNEISSTDTNGNISLNPNGNGTVDVNSSRITNLAEPTSSTDAATKAYVDATAEGLHVKPAVLSATTAPLTATYDNGTNGIDATLNLGPLVTLDIDGQDTWSFADGVLVKNQTNAFENGRYYIFQVGDDETDWILKRCIACDEADEIPSAYVFVQGGATYEATGWVALVENPDSFTVGEDDITWVQFSGAGTYTAGNGLTLDGTVFEIDDNVVVTHEDLDGFLNSEEGEEGTTILYVQDYVANSIAIGDATATPTYLALDVNSVALQVASEANAVSANVAVTAYSFDKDIYRTAKFLVKIAHGTHTEVSEVLLTLDTSDNIAITEYAVVGTNGSASAITADVVGDDVRLRVTPVFASSEIKVFGTLLID